MEAIEKVSAEIEKVITKFSAINDHSSKVLSDEVVSLQILKESLAERKHLKKFN
jgi:hypothetical protein